MEVTKSSFSFKLSGVPQGTVLGPILFILYIDDQLDIILTALGKIYVDGTKLIDKITDLPPEDLFNVICWAVKNNMQVNKENLKSSI